MQIGSQNDNLYFFIPRMQALVINDLMKNSEEKEFFIHKVEELRQIVETMPKIGDTASEKAYLHYFGADRDFWVFEKDCGDPNDQNPGEQLQAYGMYKVGNMKPKWGYISISEIIKNRSMAIDLHFTPKSSEEIINGN